MNARKWFVPADGMSIVDPHTRAVCPPAGKWVAMTDEYYVRREIDGDGQLLEQAPAEAGEAE